jgi:phytoene/squalene synthetase
VDWWSVTLEARTEAADLIDDEAIGKFLDLSEPYSGSLSAGTEPSRWTATVSLEAESAADGVTEAVRLLTILAADAGLPVWPVVRAEAVREDVLDDEIPTPLGQ